jgi:PPOX class probable F420-dependent enzyme
VILPDGFVQLLRKPSPCFITTLMPDGSPQTTLTWVDTDGEHVLVNTVETHQKVKNVRRDPRVSVAVADPANLMSYCAIRGRVVKITTEGAVQHIDALAHRYTGQPYAWYGGRDQVRVVLTIEADKVHSLLR